MSSLSSSSTTLPLSSLLASSAPQHPLPRLLTDPILPRVAAFEAAFLLSRPAALLLRLGLASERGLVAVALAAVAAGVTRWRAQWRAMLWALGVGEALARTVRVLRRRGRSAEGEKGRDIGDEDARRQADEETEHVLAWWLLFAALSLLDTLRTSPTSAPPSSLFSLPSRLRTLLRTLRHTYLRCLRLYVLPPLLRARFVGRQLVERYPRLDPSPLTAKLPSLAVPALLQRRASPLPLRPAFPQPRLHALSSPSRALPLSWSYFASPAAFSPSPSSSPLAQASAAASAEKRWEVIKLLLLWTGLWRDAFGARSVLWQWVLEPLLGGSENATRETVEVRAVRRSEQEKEDRSASRRSSNEERRRTVPAVGQDDASSPLSSSSTSFHLPHPAPYSLPSSAAFSWTPTRPSPSRSPGGSNSTTPRHALSLASAARSPSPTPSSAPFAFPTPTSHAPSAPRSLTHPLIPLTLTLPPARSPSFSSRGRLRPASSSSGAKTGTAVAGRGGGRREKRASLLFESPPKAATAFPSSSSSESESESEGEGESGLDAFRAHLQRDDDEEEEEGLDIPQTPGEEEASEDARGWGDVRMGLERTLSEAGDGEGHGGEGEGRRGAATGEGEGRWSV